MRQVIADGSRNARSRQQCRHSDAASRSRATLFAAAVASIRRTPQHPLCTPGGNCPGWNVLALGSRLAARSNKSGQWNSLCESDIFFIVISLVKGFGNSLGAV
jgi:hypothetical protein